jgi:septum site-determining protein MinC
MSATEAFTLKGRMATLSVLEIIDPGRLFDQLDQRLAQVPGFFDGMPLVVMPGPGVDFSHEGFAALIDGLRERGLLPVAGSGLPAAVAAAAGLGVMRNPAGHERAEKPSPANNGAATAATGQTPAGARDNPRSPARRVDQPVRSGQQIYARGGDLVVTAPVSAGAEVMADGHVHIYGPLRGRALAGVQGDRDARIFCQSLEAELVAVAGQYRLSEQLPVPLRGKPAMMGLQQDELQVEAL